MINEEDQINYVYFNLDSQEVLPSYQEFVSQFSKGAILWSSSEIESREIVVFGRREPFNEEQARAILLKRKLEDGLDKLTQLSQDMGLYD